MDRTTARNRAIDLASQMTIQEKIGQLKYNSEEIERLNIPAYNWWNEGLHGVARAGTATVFPQAIGLGATFNEDLLRKIGDVVATEGRAKYNEFSKRGDRDIYKGLTYWSPNINIFRDPRWGRGQETYGEDPYLTSILGCSFVNGVQGDDDVMKAAACAKHFAVHSGPEATRHSFNSIANKKDLEETYYPAFRYLVNEAKVEGVMGAYNRINGELSNGSKKLIQELLRDDWGFEGYYVSDCGAITDFHEYHKVTSNAKESATLAINAGCDLNCGETYLHMQEAYDEGLVSDETITESVVRLLTTRILLGLFDETEFDDITYEVIESDEHVELAKQASRESIVLLKNDDILPLDKSKLETIGVIGPNANSRAALLGNYHGTSSEYITIVDGIKSQVGNDVRVIYAEGSQLIDMTAENLAQDHDRVSEAVVVAEQSDVVVLAVGLDATLEGEQGDAGNEYASGDKLSLKLPESQRVLIEAMSKTNTPVILCLMSGSAIDLSFETENFPAILQAWYPGARGGEAVAEIIFGDISPSGKLPITFYDGLEGLPEFEDYSMEGRTYRYINRKPQYPFGFGLTFSQLEIVDASFSSEVDNLKVKAKVKNIGEVETGDVVQVYIKNEESEHAPLNPVLAAFKRIHLNVNKEIDVEIPIDKKMFTVVDNDGNRFIDGNKYKLYIGTSQPDEHSVQLTGVKPISLDIKI